MVTEDYILVVTVAIIIIKPAIIARTIATMLLFNT
jgi:hypothetical protein